MLKFACLGAKSCANGHIKNPNYEIISYGSHQKGSKNQAVNQSWGHSTQVDMVDHDGPVRSRHVPNFDVYAKTRTLVRQQTVSLVQHGYYNDVHSDDTNSSGDSFLSSSDCSRQINNSYSTQSVLRESTEIPSSLVTTTFSSMSSFASSFSGDEFYSMLSMDVQTSDVYICTSKYKSTISGDLNVDVGERVMLVHMPKAENRFVLVKSLSSQKCGYVPRYCLTQQQLPYKTSQPEQI